MKKTLFLGTALMIGAVGFAQNGAKKAKEINPKYLQKASHVNKMLATDPKPTPGKPVSPTISKLRPGSVQGGTNSCGLEEFTTSWNAFGVGGGSTTSAQNCLSYNTDLNTLVWTQRGSKTWSLNTGSGFLQATLINATTLATDSIIMYKAQTNHGRYPSGTLVNPLGNTDIHKTFAIAFGPALDAGATNWVGTAYPMKSLGSMSAVNHTAPTHDSLYEDSGTGQIFGNCMGSDLLGAASNDLTYLPDGKTFVTVGSIQNADVTAGDATGDNTAIRGAMFVKGVVNAGSVTLTVDTTSMIPDVYVGTLKYCLTEPRMAFGPDGMTGYVVMLGRMATNYGNYSDSTMTPIVYKTTDGGNTWSLLSNLLGYDWMCRHPEVMQGVGEVQGGGVSGYSFYNWNQGADLAVDKNNMLHFVTTVAEPFGYSDATGTAGHGNPDSMAVYGYLYHYDFVDHHPIIWDFMTDGNDWSTMIVDSIISSDLGSSSDDTTSASSPMGGSQILGVHSHIQVSRSLDGSKIFYGWADSDPNVVGTNIYGQALNTNPDIMVKAWDINTNMVSNTMNTTMNNPYTGSCFYPYLSDISYNDGTNWVVPAVFTIGHVVVSNGGGYNVYDASSQVDYYYSNCGTFGSADFANTASINMSQSPCNDPMGISKTKTFDAAVTNYPNPFNGTTTISVTLSESKSFSVNVYNTIGALVYSKTVNGNVGTNNISFDGSALNAGVYYYTVNAGNQQTTKKMVIAK